MNTLFLGWKIIRYILCGLVALWGFIKIFSEGIDTGGATLLFIAFIGAASTFIIDAFRKNNCQ